jgi:hypothetical protein
MRLLIHRIRAKFSPSYRIRHGYGLEVLRNEREVKALYEFCKNELESRLFLDPKCKEIYQTTVDLYGDGSNNDFYDYVEKHVGWYWN